MRKALLYIFLLCLLTGGYSKDMTGDYIQSRPGANSLNSGKWEKLKDDYRYTYSKPGKKKKKPEEGFRLPKFNPGRITWTESLSYVFIFLLAGLALYLLLRYGKWGSEKFKKQEYAFDISGEPDDIDRLETDTLLREAILQKNFRLAIRLRFLETLRHLNRERAIRWARYKTNRQYEQELRGSDLYFSFRHMCQVYEATWYGNTAIGERGYFLFNDQFLAMQTMLRKEMHV